MSLLAIAELLAGEALVTPGGPVDRLTAVADEDLALWSSYDAAPKAAQSTPGSLDVQAELALQYA